MLFMICSCNVYCNTKTESKLEDLGLSLEDVPGHWLPFTFKYEYLMAIKVASDDVEDDLYNCTVLFMDNDDTFVIDLSYDDVLEQWKNFLNSNQ